MRSSVSLLPGLTFQLYHLTQVLGHSQPLSSEVLLDPWSARSCHSFLWIKPSSRQTACSPSAHQCVCKAPSLNAPFSHFSISFWSGQKVIVLPTDQLFSQSLCHVQLLSEHVLAVLRLGKKAIRQNISWLLLGCCSEHHV